MGNTVQTIDISRAAESLAGMVADWYGNTTLPNAIIPADIFAKRLARFCHGLKQLEWLNWPEAFPAPVWVGETPFGSYTIEETHQSDSPAYEVRYVQQLVSIQDSLEDAKRDAQFDLDRRAYRLFGLAKLPSLRSPSELLADLRAGVPVCGETENGDELYDIDAAETAMAQAADAIEAMQAA